MLRVPAGTRSPSKTEARVCLVQPLAALALGSKRTQEYFGSKGETEACSYHGSLSLNLVPAAFNFFALVLPPPAASWRIVTLRAFSLARAASDSLT